MGKTLSIFIGVIALFIIMAIGLGYWWDHTPLYQTTTKGGIKVIYRPNHFSIPTHPKLYEVEIELTNIPGTNHKIGFILACPGISYSDSAEVNLIVDSTFKLLTLGKLDSITNYLPKPYRLPIINHGSWEDYSAFYGNESQN